jgi:hypothetical protein
MVDGSAGCAQGAKQTVCQHLVIFSDQYAHALSPSTEFLSILG